MEEDKKSVMQFLEGNKPIFLNSSFRKCDQPPELKISLFCYQRVVVQALMEIERNRDLIPNINLGGMILAEPVGSGKTFEILALIALTKNNPPDVRKLINRSYYTSDIVGNIYTETVYKNTINTTLVFVASSVTEQWRAVCENLTTLRFLLIDNGRSLDAALPLFERDEMGRRPIENYDLVLIKNTTTTSKLKNFPSEIPLFQCNKTQNRRIYTIISNLLYKTPVKRVIMDDADVVGTPGICPAIPAETQILVSSTQKTFNVRQGDSKQEYPDILAKFPINWKSMFSAAVKFGNVEVRNELKYIEENMKIPIPRIHMVLTKDPQERIIGLIGDMDCSPEIKHMLNNGAISNAASAVGIEQNSVADIFAKILGNRFNEYKYAGDVCAFIQYWQPKLTELPLQEVAKENMIKDMEEKKMTPEMYVDVRFGKNQSRYKQNMFIYHKSDILDFIDPFYFSPPVVKLFEETAIEYKRELDKKGGVINRVKENISQGDCGVCCLPLKNTELFIHKCGFITCKTCTIQVMNVGAKLCPICRVQVKFKEYIFLNKDMDLGKIVQEDFDYEINTEKKKEIELKKKGDPYESSKFDNMIKIITGKKLGNDTRITIDMGNAMTGTCYMEPAKLENQKTLIFASFDESIGDIIRNLETNKIKYWEMKGHRLAETVREFSEYKGHCVLVINSSVHCSGLNLQCANNLIFTCKLPNHSVETQVIGRIQRIGRDSPAEIYFLLYENEKEVLASSNGFKILSKEELERERNNLQNIVLKDDRVVEDD